MLITSFKPAQFSFLLCSNMVLTVECRCSNLKKYFVPESDMSRYDWIQNPFEVERVCHLTLKAQEEFAELSSDSSLKIMFAKKSLN